MSGGGTSGTVTLTNADKGSSQNIYKNIAVSGQSTVVADSNNDTLTLVASGGMTITTNATTDTITFNPNDNNDNFYLNGISKSGNTLTFSVSGTTNQTYTFGGNEVLVNGTTPAQVANPDLRWESVAQLNIGAEIRAYDYLTFGFDVFNRRTNDMKTRPPLPDYIGNDAPTANVGSMLSLIHI